MRLIADEQVTPSRFESTAGFGDQNVYIFGRGQTIDHTSEGHVSELGVVIEAGEGEHHPTDQLAGSGKDQAHELWILRQLLTHGGGRPIAQQP